MKKNVHALALVTLGLVSTGLCSLENAVAAPQTGNSSVSKGETRRQRRVANANLNKVRIVSVTTETDSTRIVVEGTQAFTPQISYQARPTATVVTFPGLLDGENAGYKNLRQNGVWNVRYANQDDETVQVVANTATALSHSLSGTPDRKRWEVTLWKPGKAAVPVAMSAAPVPTEAKPAEVKKPAANPPLTIVMDLKPSKKAPAKPAGGPYTSLLQNPGAAAQTAEKQVAMLPPTGVKTVLPEAPKAAEETKKVAVAPIFKAAPETPTAATVAALTAPIAMKQADTVEDRKVSLDFVAADINDVLKAMSLQSGINIVTGTDVQGKVTVALKRVSLLEALDVVTRLSNFTYAKWGSAYVVGSANSVQTLIGGPARDETPVTEFMVFRYTPQQSLYAALTDKFPGIRLTDPVKESDAPASNKIITLTDTKERLAAIRTFIGTMEDMVVKTTRSSEFEFYTVKYANIIDLIGMIARMVPTVTVEVGPTQGFSAGSGGGSVASSPSGTLGSAPPAIPGSASGGATTGGTAGPTSDNRGPRIMILRGGRVDIDKAKELLARVDVQIPQIIYEAKVMDVNKEDLQKLGLLYDVTTPIRVGEPNPSATGPGPFGDINLGPSTQQFPANRLQFGQVLRSPYTIGVTLNALGNNNRTRILASPTLSALDGESASAFIGDQIKYVISVQQTTQGQTIQTETATVGITLKVTGKASSDGFITLYVHPEVSTISSFLNLSNGISLPQISTRFVDTTVRVKNGETIAIGGLIQERDIKLLQKVPILGDIPFLGQLFRRSDITKSRSELMVFIKATVKE